MIKVITLITEFRFVAQDEEAVRKSLRNQELLFVLRRQRHAIPFSICFGFRSQIHRHIKYSAAHHANQLRLRILLLEVQAAQHAPDGHGLIVLHKADVNSRLPHIPLAVGLHKIAARIAVDGGRYHAKPLYSAHVFLNSYLTHLTNLPFTFRFPSDNGSAHPAKSEAA